jgi:predicted transcriptional regulator
MLTDFMSLTPTATLGDVSRLILAGSQQDFPVVENGRVVGMLLSEDIFAAIKVHPANTPVDSVMRTDFDTLEEGEMLDDALSELRHEHGLTVPVMRKGVIAGLLTAENLSELHLLRSATSEHHGYSHYTIRFSIKPNLHPRNAASHS